MRQQDCCVLPVRALTDYSFPPWVRQAQQKPASTVPGTVHSLVLLRTDRHARASTDGFEVPSFRSAWSRQRASDLNHRRSPLPTIGPACAKHVPPENLSTDWRLIRACRFRFYYRFLIIVFI